MTVQQHSWSGMPRLASACAGGGALLAAVFAIAAALCTPDFSHLPDALRPHRPPIIRVLNGVGTALVRLGLLALPTEEAAIAAACRAAKLPDGAACLVDDPAEADDMRLEWRKGLSKLLSSYQADANLTALGHLVASGQLETWLKARIRLIHAWDALPPGTLSAERVERPILIVGLPRTGTTFLFNLLMQDPALRAPLHWELVEPVPGVGEPPLGAQHVAKIQARLEGFTQLLPGIEDVHPMEATMAEECIAAMAHEFSSLIFTATFNVASYSEWLLAKPSPSHAHVFRWHRKLLQLLQLREHAETEAGAGAEEEAAGAAAGAAAGTGARATRRRRQWVLKTPWYGHGPVLEAALAEYSDALVVHTHRAPAAVVGSLASLLAKFYGAGSHVVDLHSIGAAQASKLERMAASVMATRARWRAESPALAARVADVELSELKRDPLGVVERIYAHFGMELGAKARSAMEAWLQRKRVRHGGHRFELASFGLAASEVTARPVWRSYCEEYVPHGCDAAG